MTIDIISLYCYSELICINVQSLKSFITVWEYNLFKAFILFKHSQRKTLRDRDVGIL